MKFNFDKPMLGLDDQPMTIGNDQIIMGKLLANRLSSVSRGPVMKFFDWAKLLYAGQEINIDREDVRTLQDFIREDDQITILAKAQLLQVLNTDENQS